MSFYMPSLSIPWSFDRDIPVSFISQHDADQVLCCLDSANAACTERLPGKAVQVVMVFMI